MVIRWREPSPQANLPDIPKGLFPDPKHVAERLQAALNGDRKSLGMLKGYRLYYKTSNPAAYSFLSKWIKIIE